LVYVNIKVSGKVCQDQNLVNFNQENMAILRLENGTIYHNLSDIGRELSSLNIQLNSWPIGDNPLLVNLLEKDHLNEQEKEQALTDLDHYFQELREKSGYKTRDLIVINPDIPNIDMMLSKFDKCHTHADDEVRYIVAGEGIFGFVRPDGSQVELMVQSGEYINVPAHTEHWFYLGENKRVKAVRYFTSMEGWVPVYTGTPIRSIEGKFIS
jgi:1,2-dihydroxy-3-keto-5-methylthiopentene dioxygenase